MSSNIKIQRICEHCGVDFTARTTVTRFCGDACAKRAHKARVRSIKIERSNEETRRIKVQPIEEVKGKDFLTVKDLAKLLSCSSRTAYRLIEQGHISAINLAQRMTRVSRTELDQLFRESSTRQQPVVQEFKLSDCYSLSDVQIKYGISETGLQKLVKRHNVPKVKKGRFAYVPKKVIDNLLKSEQ